jgi:formamidopyrimidine-DNA glycosylase
MPELPDVVVYIEALQQRISGAVLQRVSLPSMFVLRSVDPPISSLVGARVAEVRRLGKRIAIGFDNHMVLVIHLMIAGRLQWKDRDGGTAARNILASFEFDTGTLMLTEAGSRKRASIHVVRGIDGLRKFDRGALEILETTEAEFAGVLRSENHTLKRSLTDPRLFSGIGNAYSDEILHRAQLSPLALTSKLSDSDIAKIFESCRAVLSEWTDRLRVQSGKSFPSKVTAFHPEMAVHGRFGKPCPVCGSPVQRIVYAENECNYCATCQTGGRLLADRAMSRLLKDDWPRSLEEMEKHFDDRR